MFRAEIKGDKTSLEILNKNFADYILVEEGKYYLTCQQFQTVNKDDLFSFAEEKLKQLLLILNLKVNQPCNAMLGAIENVKEDGKKVNFARAKGTFTKTNAKCPYSLSFKDKETGEVRVLDPYKCSEDLKPYLKCMANNKNVRTVLQYLKDKNGSNSAFKLYKILEVIGNDIGSKKNIPKQFNCISKRKFSNLTYTLNNGMGKKSRHHEESPIESKILSEEEINVLMKEIINEWILLKCN